MSDPSKSLSIGAPRPARVADLEAELSALWRAMSEDAPAANPVMRACALTLLVYTEGAEAQNEIAQALAAVTPQNPCRALVMIVEPAARESGLEGWVSAHCHRPLAGEKQVCCEQVTLIARGEAVRDLDNVIVPLIVPGLPAFLWWRGGRFAPADYFEPILRATDRVVVDSARFEKPRADLVALAAEFGKRKDWLAISDLNWARGVGWREAVAQCFDPPQARARLQRIREVEIVCAGPRGMAQALLLSGWLVARLNWNAKQATDAKDEIRLRFESSGGEVEARVAAGEESEANAAGISRVAIRTDSERRTEFQLGAGPGGACLRARCEGEGEQAVERSVVMPPADEGALLNRQLQRAGRDKAFEEALAVIAGL